MSVPVEHYMNVRNGAFNSTTRQELADAMAAFKAAGNDTLVIHMHGGLVNESRGMAIAEALMEEYRDADAYPYFIVWESGLLETLTANLGEILDEDIFQRLLRKVLRFVVSKVKEETVGARSAGPLTLEDESAVGDELDRVAAEGGPAYGELGADLEADTELSYVQSQQFQADLQADPGFQAEAEAIAAALLESERVVETEEGLVRGGRVRLSTRTLMDPEVLADVRDEAPSPDERGLITAATLVRKALVALTRVLKRFVDGSHHGIHATVVEEILRAFYLANAGGLVWEMMKKDTADAFGPDGQVHGGTALLDELDALWAADPDTRVVLVGHSTGAVYISHLLKAAAARDPVLSGAFEVVFLAPAVTFELFDEGLAAGWGLVAGAADGSPRIRSFAMRDALEKDDVLVPFLYPHSLLYFVAGVCEDAVDKPLVGMERYHRPPWADDEPVSSVLARLAPAEWRVWSTTSGAPAGRRSDSTGHTAFDDAGSDTMASVQHILSAGF